MKIENEIEEWRQWNFDALVADLSNLAAKFFIDKHL